MKKVFAISMLIALCFQLVLKLGIVAWYKVNQQYVSANLCENRNKPQMKCHGKCYLRKQLNKADKQDNGSNQQQSKSQQNEITECVFALQATHYVYHPVILQQHHDNYKAPHSAMHRSSVFHPPPVA